MVSYTVQITIEGQTTSVFVTTDETKANQVANAFRSNRFISSILIVATSASKVETIVPTDVVIP